MTAPRVGSSTSTTGERREPPPSPHLSLRQRTGPPRAIGPTAAGMERWQQHGRGRGTASTVCAPTQTELLPSLSPTSARCSPDTPHHSLPSPTADGRPEAPMQDTLQATQRGTPSHLTHAPLVGSDRPSRRSWACQSRGSCGSKGRDVLINTMLGRHRDIRKCCDHLVVRPLYDTSTARASASSTRPRSRAHGYATPCTLRTPNMRTAKPYAESHIGIRASDSRDLTRPDQIPLSR